MAKDRLGRPVQEEVLEAALQLAGEDWTFSLLDVVRTLPHLNESSVRTHVGSRCCVDAPSHHQHRWGYFRRVGRGIYRIEPEFRRRPWSREKPKPAAMLVRESSPAFLVEAPAVPSTIHAVVTESEEWYVAECLEVAIVTQGRTLDELMVGLREAVDLHMEDEDPAALGLSPRPRLSITYEFTLSGR